MVVSKETTWISMHINEFLFVITVVCLFSFFFFLPLTVVAEGFLLPFSFMKEKKNEKFSVALQHHQIIEKLRLQSNG